LYTAHLLAQKACGSWGPKQRQKPKMMQNAHDSLPAGGAGKAHQHHAEAQPSHYGSMKQKNKHP